MIYSLRSDVCDGTGGLVSGDHDHVWEKEPEIEIS